jgi:hypothetical protein
MMDVLYNQKISVDNILDYSVMDHIRMFRNHHNGNFWFSSYFCWFFGAFALREFFFFFFLRTVTLLDNVKSVKMKKKKVCKNKITVYKNNFIRKLELKKTNTSEVS